MEAKDRLRLYLEQRRELGESELVLDALPVDEVLRMLGAPRRASNGNLAVSGKDANVEPPAAADGPPGASVPEPPLPLPTEVIRPSAAGSLDVPATGTGTQQESFEAQLPPQSTTSGSPAERTPSDWRNVLRSGDEPPAQPLHDGAPATTGVPVWLANLGVPVGLSATPLRSEKTSAIVAELPDLGAVASVIAGCRACPLGALALNPVPGEGNPEADFVCVGEAPGQTEDETGRPFVGAAGQLLTKILGAISLRREDVFICNVLKHRPPGNRNPMPDEVRACTPYLTRQLELLKPKVILALGTFAAQTLLNTPTALGKLRGSVHSYQGIPLIVTYHPAALLRNESWKRPAWDDVKLARRILDAARAEAGGTL